MRYSKYLEKRLYKPFERAYVPYRVLRRLLRAGADREKEFQRRLSEEFSSVFGFAEEQLRRLRAADGRAEDEDARRRDMHGLAAFVRANVKGFERLLALHDRKSESRIAGEYALRLRRWRHRLRKIDSLAERADARRRGPHHVEKYWISDKDTVFMKMGLSRGMREGMASFREGVLSTIYLDNSEFQGYTAMLCGLSGASTVRISWEGNARIVKVERTVQGRTTAFYMRDADVLEYLRGEDVLERARELNAGERSAGLEEAYRETQRAVRERGLRPMLRTVCKRLFIAADGVEAVLESQIAMVRECSAYEASAGITPRQWRRGDVEGEWPYGRVKAEDIVRFPYSVLRVSYETMPSWLSALLSDCGADRVDAFSKVLHGAASLFKEVEPTPYWMARLAPDEPSMSLPSAAPTPVQPIAIPVRVEPKVFFANERTFLSWVQFAIFLGGIGTAMLGLGDNRASLCGLMLIIVASIFSIYSLYLFHWRLQRIRERDPGPYDDRYGPTILVCVFLLAIVMACVFKMPLKHGYRLN